MIAESVFDDVHDCLKAFRGLLHAMSNPGEIVCINEQAKKLEGSESVMLTLALTLLDKETSFYAPDNADFAKTAAELTYSRHTEEKAGFIFTTGKCPQEAITDIFSKAFPGTFVEPHTNSVLIVAVDGFEERATCRLTGPGIKASKQAGLSAYAKQWIIQRDLMEYEYPTGIDLCFVAPDGKLMAVPRKVKAEGWL